MTHSESRIGSQLQETFHSWQAEVGCSDVQGSAKVKVTTGGIYFYKNRYQTETLVRYVLYILWEVVYFWHFDIILEDLNIYIQYPEKLNSWALQRLCKY